MTNETCSETSFDNLKAEITPLKKGDVVTGKIRKCGQIFLGKVVKVLPNAVRVVALMDVGKAVMENCEYNLNYNPGSTVAKYVFVGPSPDWEAKIDKLKAEAAARRQKQEYFANARKAEYEGTTNLYNARTFQTEKFKNEALAIVKALEIPEMLKDENQLLDQAIKLVRKIEKNIELLAKCETLEEFAKIVEDRGVRFYSLAELHVFQKMDRKKKATKMDYHACNIASTRYKQIVVK